jgi:hypothetical protein
MTRARRERSRGWAGVVVTGLVTLGLVAPATAASAQASDPRAGLRGGLQDAAQASSNIDLLAHLDKPAGFINPTNIGDLAFANSDLAFSRNHAFVGSFRGALIYDIRNPSAPRLRTAVNCPGGQGDVSVIGNLMFLSVQQNGTVDCQVRTPETPANRIFNGVRVFDISNLDNPVQVAAVQTCRGSHTHTVVEDPKDASNVYVYVNGTSPVRQDTEHGIEGGCEVGPTTAAPTEADPGRRVPSNDPADFDANTRTDRFQIEVIQVPVAAPQNARIVAKARLFADEATGSPFGLRALTNTCHDITAYPEIGLAAGACQGDGLLIDISDPVAPKRIDAVGDPNFAYWHSATFNNDGTKVVFTDELGGGAGAVCQPSNTAEEGANAIYDIVGTGSQRRLQFASYFKIPNVQTATENCVAHNGSLIPVPGRDIMVQAWYQGGLSVFDFTDSRNPVEIAYLDRGPIDEQRLVLGGYWSAYYYNGHVYGTEIVRGFDVLKLTPSTFLSQAQLDAAASVRLRDFNPQAQTRITDADRSAAGGVTPKAFSDSPGPPHGANIGTVAGYGIADGFTDGTFRPAAPVRRDQMASFIQRELRVAGVAMPANPRNAFTDDEGNVHELAINQLAALGVINGRTATTYSPAELVSRDQTASLIVRAVEQVLQETLPSPRSPFTDVPSGGVHTRAIDAGFAAGLITGRTATTFEPRANVRRDQMASFLSRSLELLFDRLVELKPLR